jgi:hypothetical protein
MNEHDIQNLILRELSLNPGVRLFRNNVGQGWVGKMLEHRNGVVVLDNARPLHAGLFNGSGDLIGWHSKNGVAKFVSLEVKTGRGRTRPEQQLWMDIVNKAGGVAGIVRSPLEALELLKP